MTFGRKLFDPLQYLEHELLLSVSIDRNDRIKLDGISQLNINLRKRAVWVLRNYDSLLRMQLMNSRRPSVYKLIAKGKIKIQKGRFKRVE